MGNKTSKKTGASMAADKYKRPLSTSCRGSTQPVARHQDDRSEWVMVLNATAYIRSGTLGNAGVTPRGAKQTESQHPVRTVQRNEGKSHHPISNIKEKNTVVSHTQHNFCVNKQMGIVATPQNYNTDNKPAVTGNTITVCNSAARKDIFEARLTANKGNDWSKTMTLKANEAKQQTTGCTGREQLHLQIEDKPQHNQIAQLGIDRDARAVEGFMWQQVNRAERGRWNHFRRVGGGKYKCTMCNVSLSSQQSVIEHVWGKFHQANLDKKCVNETEEDLMWRQVPNPEKFHRNYINEIDADNKPLFYCSICKVELPFTYQNLLTHIRGRNHREEVKFQ